MLITLEAVVAQVVRQQEEYGHDPTFGFERAYRHQHCAGCIHVHLHHNESNALQYGVGTHKLL